MGKWTDTDGSELMGRVFGDNFLPIVLSRKRDGDARRWDSVAGYPFGLAAIPGLKFLDVDHGVFYSSNMERLDSHLGRAFTARMLELHFAKVAIGAMSNLINNYAYQDS